MASKIVKRTPRPHFGPVSAEAKQGQFERTGGKFALEPPGPILRGDRVVALVPPGLGDIFWTYQKLAACFDEIEYKIAVYQKNDIQCRSAEWMHLFPKVKKFDFEIVDGNTMTNLVTGHFSLRKVLEDAPHKIVHYACNRWLEDGHRLDALDKGYGLEWDIPLPNEPVSLPYKQYLVLYVSGSAKNSAGVWQAKMWVDLAYFLRDRFGPMPVVVIGATFDQDMIELLDHHLKHKKIPYTIWTGKSPGQVIHLLQHCRFFAGFQSGLNVVADNFDIPQLMVYYPHLDKMRNTWCKPAHLTDGTYNSTTFSDATGTPITPHQAVLAIR